MHAPPPGSSQKATVAAMITQPWVKVPAVGDQRRQGDEVFGTETRPTVKLAAPVGRHRRGAPASVEQPAGNGGCGVGVAAGTDGELQRTLQVSGVPIGAADLSAVYGHTLMKDTFRRIVAPHLVATRELANDFDRPAEFPEDPGSLLPTGA